MRTRKAIIISILLLLLIGCEEKETNTTYDFKVLGVEKIIINNSTEITIDSEGVPAKSGNLYSIVGASNGASSLGYDLAVWETTSEEPIIRIQSKYDDSLVNIEKKSESRCYIITITRNGYDVKLTYKLEFVKSSSN
jgi:hypothetical protein